MAKLLFIILLFLQSIANADHPAIHPDRKLTVGVVTEVFPPYQYVHNGVVVGPMHRIMQHICEKAGMACTFAILPWTDALTGAEEGVYDVLYSVIDVAKRREKFILGPPIINSHYSAFVLSRNPWVYIEPSSLSGLTIGVYGPSGTSIIAETAAAQASNSTLRVQKTVLESFQMLVEGAYGKDGVVIANKDVGQFLLRERGIVGPKVAGSVTTTTYTFGVSRKAVNAEVVAERLSTALKALQQEGVIQKIIVEAGLDPAAFIPK